MQTSVGSLQAVPPATVVCERVVGLQPDGTVVKCLFSNDGFLNLSGFLAGFIRPSDHLEFDPASWDSSPEFRILQRAGRRPRELHFGSIGYVTQPKADKRNEYFLRAEVTAARLGINAVQLSSEAVREYFYLFNRRCPNCEEETLYDVLRAAPSASPADLRLAFRLRMLELETAGAQRDELRAVERAFNLLANHELRSCYQTLLLYPDAPALFPYGGFGSLLTLGELSSDRSTFFAKRILSFLPDRRERRFRAPLRKIEFLDGYAVYRDGRRKAELILDPISLPVSWDPTWNQWRHLVCTKFGVEATFVKNGKYRFHRGEWHLVEWETALPSRQSISLPADNELVLAAARKTFHRFGQFFDSIQRIRTRLEREPLERQELTRVCNQLGIPSDFDIAQISWKPDYDAFYYSQLKKRTRKMYLFRDEYIFELERALVVEVPEQGHATYIFSRHVNLEQWVREYCRTSKDDIRRNRANAAERLGFVGRVMHGRNPRTWLRELRAKTGEPVDYSLAVDPS